MTPYGLPSEHYHCLLDEQPYYLVPTRLFGPDIEGPLMCNPECWFSWHGPLPPDKAARAVGHEAFLQGPWMVWVSDAASGGVWPYLAGPEFAGYLGHLVPGQPLSVELPPHARWILTRAGILVGQNHAERRRRAWLAAIFGAASRYERGHAALEGLVPPFHLGAARRYFRHQIRAGAFVRGDDQVDHRYAAHNEGVARYFHRQLTTAVGDVARRVVKPSYVYLAAYESGSVLERHTDREQCEYSVTMLIDWTPEPEGQSPWPIDLSVADGTLRVFQHVGEALLYRGCQVPHAREELAPGCTSTSLLFHYVDEDFGGTLS